MTLFDRAVALTLPFVPKPIVRKVAGRYIAGEAVDDAIRVAAGLNKMGIRATMDVLGEDVHSREQAQRAVQQYIILLQEIDRRKLDSNVSIKLTQLGLKLDRQFCLDLADQLVSEAGKLG